MKKGITVKNVFEAIFVLAIIIAIVLGNSMPAPKKRTQEVAVVKWSIVNVREEHSTGSRIITAIKKGTEVIPTGKKFEYFGGIGSVTDRWMEVQLSDGTIGWIVSRSIN